MTIPPSDDLADAKRRAEKRFLGGLLMAGGGLIGGLCGLCTLGFAGAFVVAAFQSPGQAAEALGLVVIPVLVGGLPTAGGAVLFWIGRRMYHEGRKP